MNKIGILKIGNSGNNFSIKKAILSAQGEYHFLSKKEDFKKINKIIIPGVGSFHESIKIINEVYTIEFLKDQILSKPTLGICLGMQILASIGFEGGVTKGLEIINGEVRSMDVDGKVPHMGFNEVIFTKKSRLFENIKDNLFYFMHSYEFNNYENIIGLSSYCGHKFVAAVELGNIFGVQFHPEKSRDQGVELIRNFLKI